MTAHRNIIHGERIEIVDDPLGIRRKVAKFTVFDADRGPTENPRASIHSPALFREGSDIWMGWATLFPKNGFPPSVPGWLTFEGVHGPPADGAGPRHLQVEGDEIMWRRNETYGYDEVWSMPLIRGRWIDFVVHQKQSSDGQVGFVELWTNTGSGWRQESLGGQMRLFTRTRDHSNGDAPNSHILTLYRRRGMFDVITLYHAAHKLGTSFDAVAPRSYARSP